MGIEVSVDIQQPLIPQDLKKEQVKLAIEFHVGPVARRITLDDLEGEHLSENRGRTGTVAHP